MTVPPSRSSDAEYTALDAMMSKPKPIRTTRIASIDHLEAGHRQRDDSTGAMNMTSSSSYGDGDGDGDGIGDGEKEPMIASGRAQIQCVIPQFDGISMDAAHHVLLRRRSSSVASNHCNVSQSMSHDISVTTHHLCFACHHLPDDWLISNN